MAELGYLSVEFDSEDVVGVTIVADFRPLLEMVDVHALWHRGAHHNYQTAGEKTLHDVNIRGFCWGQRTVGVTANLTATNKSSYLTESNISYTLFCRLHNFSNISFECHFNCSSAYWN